MVAVVQYNDLSNCPGCFISAITSRSFFGQFSPPLHGTAACTHRCLVRRKQSRWLQRRPVSPCGTHTHTRTCAATGQRALRARATHR